MPSPFHFIRLTSFLRSTYLRCYCRETSKICFSSTDRRRIFFQFSFIFNRSTATQYGRLLAWQCRLSVCLSVFCDAMHCG